MTATPAVIDELAQAIPAALASVETELATRRWLFTDPERRKALSRARDFLQRIRERLGFDADGPSAPTRAELTAVIGLVVRVADKKWRYGRENAWDLAEELRVATLMFLSDDALYCLLEKENADESAISWTRIFPQEELARLLGKTRPADFRLTTLEHLRRLHHERVDRVRHDRARDKLWQHFVWKLIPVVTLLVVTCLVVRNEEGRLPVAAGALGAILSAVLKLRDGEQRIRTLRRSATFLYLQPLIGAIAAQVMLWLGVSNILKLDTKSLEVAVGFLAGFSEPFFLGTISRLTEMPAAGKSDPVPHTKPTPIAKGT
jgi:hypothetical protein